MNYAFWTVIACCALVGAASSVTWSVAIARRIDYHRGKMDAFQEVADDFSGLARASFHPAPAREQAEERKRLMLRLCLCDENVCRALDAALSEACKYWGHPREGIFNRESQFPRPRMQEIGRSSDWEDA